MELAHDDGPIVVSCPGLSGPSERMQQPLLAVQPDRATPPILRKPAGTGRNEALFVIPADHYSSIRRDSKRRAIRIDALVERTEVYHAIRRVPAERDALI